MTRLAALLVVPVLLVAGCGGGSSTKVGAGGGTTDAAGAPGAQSAEVDGKDTLRFAPNVVQAKVGTLSLTFANTGQVPHNLVFDDSSLGRTATVNGGAKQVLTLKLDKTGSYAFQCTFHPGMTGKVVVS